MDPVSRELTGESFTLKYHETWPRTLRTNFLDFLVLRQYYDVALRYNWQPGERFRSVCGDNWLEGQLKERTRFSVAYPNSYFLCFRIRYSIYLISLEAVD